MRKILDSRKNLGLGMLMLGLMGCAGLGRHLDSQQLYERGIMDAAVASPEEIMPLKILPQTEKVRVVAWVSATRVPCNGSAPCNYATYKEGYTWVTLDGEVQQLCKSWHMGGDDLRRRLEQLLGLPPNSPEQFQKVKFITLDVPHASLARACLGVAEGATPECTLNTLDTTAPDIKHYVQQQMASAYIIHLKNQPGYPFTRLGYTYDWSPKAAKNHYGASEFLVAPDTSVNLIAISSTDDYCR